MGITVNTAALPPSRPRSATDFTSGAFLSRSRSFVRRGSVAGVDACLRFLSSLCCEALGLLFGLLVGLVGRPPGAELPAARSAVLLLLGCFCCWSIWLRFFWSGFAGLPSLAADQQRPVGAGAEALVDRVVGLARGRGLGQGADVVLAELEVEDGEREDQRTAALATSDRQGRSATPRAQRAQPCGSWSSGWVRPSLTRSELMCGPSAPSSAGSSVAAARTATTTATAAREAERAHQRDAGEGEQRQSAITTVEPAKTTAPPAVAVARAIDSRSSMPSRAAACGG